MTDARRSSVSNASGRVRVWQIGIVGWLIAVIIQLPMIVPSFRGGLDFSPGKAGLQSTWMICALALDLAIAVAWSLWRPSRLATSCLPGLAASACFFPAAFLALLLRGVFL